MRQAYKNYMRHFIPAMLIYALVLFASIYALRWLGHDAPLILQFVIALTPAIPIAYGCRAYIHYVGECDEMERRIELESIALSAMIISLSFLCLGFLASSKIIELSGAVVAIWVFPALCGTYGIAKLFIAGKYQ